MSDARPRTSALDEATLLSPEVFQRHLDEAASKALVLGGRVVATTGFAAGLGLSLFAFRDRFFLTPTLFAFFGGLWGVFLAWIARRGISRATWIALMLGMTAVPTVFFVVAELVEPIGAATYIFGPWSMLYAFGVVVTGFRLNPRLSLVAGGAAGLQLLTVFLLARPHLEEVARVLPAVGRDQADPVVWFFRGGMLFAIGGATAGVARIARWLVARTLREEREGQAVKKLFGEFVSKDVRDKILKERSGLKSERRTVAVLFSDLRGFTTYSEKTDPAVVVQRLNAYFGRMVLAIEKHGGVVDKFIGDAVMATFGGVVPVDNPASAALRAAHSMRQALGELNAAWGHEGVPPFDSGIGLHYGEVIEGPLGSAQRREYTVIGDTVNTASRVEGLTKDKHCAIVVTQALYDALPSSERAGLVDLGEAHVKGRTEPLRLWGAPAAAGAPRPS